MSGEVISLIVILLLLFVFVFHGSGAERMRRYPGRLGRPAWRPRYYRIHDAPWDYGRYGLAYRTPVYYNISVNESDKAGLVWCGVPRTGGPCSSEETVAIAGQKGDVANCPYGYTDNGFKKYSSEDSSDSGDPSNSTTSYLRVCELSI